MVYLVVSYSLAILVANHTSENLMLISLHSIATFPGSHLLGCSAKAKLGVALQPISHKRSTRNKVLVIVAFMLAVRFIWSCLMCLPHL